MRTVRSIKLCLCACLILFSFKGHAFQLIADPNYNQKSNGAFQTFLNKVADLLPAAMKSRFEERTYTVTFADFKATEMARIIPGFSKIEINKNLFPVLTESSLQNLPLSRWPSIAEKINALKKKNASSKKDLFFDLPSHHNMFEFLQATIIHEISHQYDLLGVPPMEYLTTRKQCIYAAAIGVRDSTLECQKIQNIKTSVSDLREFLTLAGYPETGFLNGSPDRNNYNTGRSPDPYEWESPMEAFAVNMEYFLLDPDYQCRRPELNNYLSKHFKNFQPFPPKTCHNTQTVLVSGPSDYGTSTRFEELDFSKLYQIHYFFAGKGDEMMSRFGHAMLRLVICAPYREKVGPECLQDLPYHRIVSFRAFISDFSINSLKGLTGKYPSSLYIIPLASVLSEYNTYEFREITSIPLRLPRTRLKRLFDSILFNHWTYESKYYFLANNCATETFNLIKSVLYDVPKIFDESVARPDSLYKLLIKIGAATDLKTLAKTEDEAVKSGYYFPSFRKTYESSLNELIKQGALDKDFTLDEYINYPADERKILIENEINSSSAPAQKIKNLAGFIFLEDLILAKTAQKINKEVLPNLYEKKQEADNGSQNEGIFKEINQVEEYVNKYSRPSTIFSPILDGRPYGQPTEDEVSPIVDSFNKTIMAAGFDKKMEQISDAIVQKASYKLQLEFNQTKENTKTLTKNIKELIKKIKKH
ncbi:MAG: DUF7844 domain-containing protein [Bdellovibrio sp.]